VIDVLGEISGEEGHDGFAFGVAEAAVVFDDLGAGGGEHESEVEEAAVGEVVFFQALDGGADDVGFDLL
jgi:hypothetical protein